jgi:nitroreductase
MVRDLIDTILSRRSIRRYREEPITGAEIKTLLEAAMAAPSASNLKPWHFIVVTRREILNKLAEAHPHAKMLNDAPLCISVCGDPDASRYWVQDCSAATENLLLAVTALGLGAVWCGVHPRPERVKEVSKILSIKPPLIPLNLIAIGHPAEEKEPRTQYDESRIHKEKW